MIGDNMKFNDRRLEYYWDEGFRYVNVSINGVKEIMSISVANELVPDIGTDFVLSVNDFGYVEINNGD